MRGKIYLITTFEKVPIGKPDFDFGDTRTVGWFMDLTTAERAVESNAGDIYEGCYKWAMIEEVLEGLYPYSPSNMRKFYKFNKEKEKYELYELSESEKAVYKLLTIG